MIDLAKLERLAGAFETGGYRMTDFKKLIAEHRAVLAVVEAARKFHPQYGELSARGCNLCESLAAYDDIVKG